MGSEEGEGPFRGFSPPRWIVSGTIDDLASSSADGSNRHDASLTTGDGDDAAAGYGPVLRRGNIAFIPAASAPSNEIALPRQSKGKHVQSLYQSIVRSASSSSHQKEEDDDDIVILDPVTRRPDPFSTYSDNRKRTRGARERAVHELVAEPEAKRPKLPVVYGIPQSNKGWQMLQRAGWSRDQPLGPSRHPLSASSSAHAKDNGEPAMSTALVRVRSDSSTDSEADWSDDVQENVSGDEDETDKRLKVPLKASEKFDRKGLGGSTETKKERKERELRDALGESKAVTARALHRKQKRETAYRKAMLAYMNRD